MTHSITYANAFIKNCPDLRMTDDEFNELERLFRVCQRERCETPDYYILGRLYAQEEAACLAGNWHEPLMPGDMKPNELIEFHRGYETWRVGPDKPRKARGESDG